jgi:pimeloyl-ACP methyl ester carboxylesterase
MAKTKKTERWRGSLFNVANNCEGIVESFDGTPISYQSTGKSDYPIMCCNGLGVGVFFWVYVRQYFSPATQIITWDYRGHGQSGLFDNIENYTLEALVKDAKSVVDDINVKKSVLIGHSLGAQVVLEFYRRYPKRVKGLILCFGTDGRPMSTFYDMRLSRYFFELCYKIGQRFPTQSNWISRLLLQNPFSFFLGGLLKIMNTDMIEREKVDQYISHLLEVDPIFFTSLLKSAQEHTAQDMLPEITVPTLIIAGQDDQFTPLWISKKMHRLIPNSELFIVKKGSHAALVEQPELINLRIEKFIQERILRTKTPGKNPGNPSKEPSDLPKESRNSSAAA